MAFSNDDSTRVTELMAAIGGDDDFAGFARLMAELSGGRDAGQVFPVSDAKDLKNGAGSIPSEVTMARRDGQHVEYIPNGEHGPTWRLPNGRHVN